MSTPINTVIIIAAAAVGYFIEPSLISRTDSEAPVEIDSSKDKVEDTTKEVVSIDLTEVIAEDFPEKVTLKEALSFSDPASGISIELEKGEYVQAVDLEGEILIVQTLELPLKSSIAVDKTNFKELVAPVLLKRLEEQNVANIDKPIIEESETELEQPVITEPVIEISNTEVEEEELSNVEVIEEPELLAPEVAEPVEKEQTVEPSLTDQEIITIMKQKVDDEMVREFTSEQVIKWDIGNKEEVDGVTYTQTGRVVFKAVTILGEETNEAVALFKNGKIEKWVWAKSMLMMK